MASDTEIRRVIRAELRALAETTSTNGEAPAKTMWCLDNIATRSLLILFFGLTPDEPRYRSLEEGFRRLGPTGFAFPIGQEQLDAFGELRAIVWQIAEALRADAPPFIRGVLARVLAEGDGSAVDETVVGNLIYMMEIGRYDMRSLLRWIVKYLSDHPSVVADLRAKPAGTEVFTSLAEACVHETLRLDQAEALTREAREEFVFDGYRVPKGSMVRVLLRESHRNADVFPEPEQYKPCRFVGKSYSPNDYSPFGVGEHRCVAAPMVVRLCTMVVEELVSGFTWTVAGDGPRIKGPHHWEPAPNFAIAPRARAEAYTHA